MGDISEGVATHSSQPKKYTEKNILTSRNLQLIDNISVFSYCFLYRRWFSSSLLILCFDLIFFYNHLALILPLLSPSVSSSLVYFYLLFNDLLPYLLTLICSIPPALLSFSALLPSSAQLFLLFPSLLNPMLSFPSIIFSCSSYFVNPFW